MAKKKQKTNKSQNISGDARAQKTEQMAEQPVFRASKPDGTLIKKLNRGERAGNCALIFCGAVLVYFAVCFPTGKSLGLYPLWFSTLVASAAMMTVGVCAAAFCNLKYGKAMEKLIDDYVREVFLENAALMHAERDSLSFYIRLSGDCVEITVNGYKEKIIFDMSPFGKLGLSKKLTTLNAIETRLCSLFCRLAERGAKYSDVLYTERADKRKPKKAVFIIKDGVPDKRALKIYYKNSN